MNCNIKKISSALLLSVWIGGTLMAQSPKAQNTPQTANNTTPTVQPVDSLKMLLEESEMLEDTVMYFLKEFVVVANIRDSKSLQEQSVTFSLINEEQIKRMGLSTTREINGLTPNLYMTDNGSSMDPIISMRGFSSSNNDPIVAMNADNVPILSRDAYSVNMFDVERIEVLRGPQGTASGRNAMMGVMNVYTLSPLKYTGTHVSADYSTANNVLLTAATYQKPTEKFGFSVAANFKHSDGFFTNSLTDEKVDKHNGVALRLRAVGKPKEKFTIDNVLSTGYISEGIYPYAITNRDDETLDIEFNEKNQYKRFLLSDGLVIQYIYDKIIFNSITGYQFLYDQTNHDADYTGNKFLLMEGEKNEHALSHEFAFRSTARETRKYNWKAGLFFYFKHSTIDHPISYFEKGINEIFCNSLNEKIQEKNPLGKINIEGDQLKISNHFETPTVGIAAYHQSEFTINKWDLTAGVRFNYEHVSIDYLSQNLINYAGEGIKDTEKKELKTHFYGTKELSEFVVLPKFAAQYNINKFNNLYLNIARGQKAGGYNVLLFSDIIQTQMINKINRELNLTGDRSELIKHDYTEEILYSPERCWNFEVGGHFLATEKNMSVNFALFYILGQNQQIHTFPTGSNMGSMIVNANRTRSVGGELSVNYTHVNPETQNVFNIVGSYGYAHAKFLDFEHNGVDLSNKRLPFAPSNTIGLNACYTFLINEPWVKTIAMNISMNGNGKIYWDTENRYSQQFYTTFDAGVTYNWKELYVRLWMRNLANKTYDTYQLSNLGNQICQKGKPRQIGISINYKFNQKEKKKEEE